MKIAFATLGCKVNQYETQALKELFKASGYEIATENDIADVCVINTCSVTNMADRKSRQTIRYYKKKNPKCIIAVTGCYAQTGTEKLMSMDEVDIIAGINEKTGLPELLTKYLNSKKPLYKLKKYEELKDFEEMGTVVSMEGRTRAYIKIQEGCNRFCSYCIIPYARGSVRSRGEKNILYEAEKLVNQGYKELVLTGINTALYGSEEDGEPKLHRLIEKLSDISGNFRIRLSSLEPTVINAEYVKKLFKYERLCHHVHLSIQSGSDAILKKMNRRYNMAEYMEIVKTLQEFDADYGISTDIIVGFPQESQEDFEKSIEITNKAGFCKVHVFKYSKRNGTVAAKMIPQVKDEEKNARSEKLIKAGIESANRFIDRNLGTKRKVLFEEYHPELGAVSGLTDNYIKVYIKTDEIYKDSLINSIENVLLCDRFLDGIKGILI